VSSGGGGWVMVQVRGFVDVEVSTCHVIKLLRVGSNDLLLFIIAFIDLDQIQGVIG
jgi:hypothetical protein